MMKLIAHQGLRATRPVSGWCTRLRDRVLVGPADRGDVPGWVLVTIMTAGLVVALWAIAHDQLSTLFTNALSQVAGGPK